MHFILIILGSLIAVLLSNVSKNYKEKKPYAKGLIFLIYSLVITLASLILLLYNGFNGNPITAIYARARMHQYLEVTYPQYDYNVHDVSYSFKSGNYSADAYMFTNEDSKAFTISYSRGDVWSDYYTLYEEDMPNSLRLAKEASLQIEALLTEASIPFDDVSVHISVPLDKYVHIPYDSNTVSEDLEITIYKYTATKESEEAFSLWCESIRKRLIQSGYPIASLSLNSDPHFLATRLELILKDPDLKSPITHVNTISKSSHFIDYGALNGYNDLSPSEWENAKALDGKDMISDKILSLQVSTLLDQLNIPFIDIDVKPYLEGLAITLTWAGDYIGPHIFADQCIRVRDTLLAHQSLLSASGISSISLYYYYGTSQDTYGYTFYADTMSQDATTILKNLLSNPKKY